MRKALGTVKDQTSIGIARVSSNVAPELDVAIVKATSHDDLPANEKYIREILTVTSYSRLYVDACVASVSRRLGKTRDWVVALKTLVLVHRLIADGDPIFQTEIVRATRRGARLLNMSDFRDEAHSNSWDLSSFVRCYALYLDQRLECYLFDCKNGADVDVGKDPYARSYSAGRSGDGGDYDSYDRSYGNGRGGRGTDYDSYGGSYGNRGGDYDSYGRSYGNGGGGRNGDNNGYGERERSYSSSPAGGKTNGDVEKKMATTTSIKEMKPERLMGRMKQLQLLMDRFLACRPTGKAKNTRIVLVALYPIIRESFQIYADICEMLAALLDRFFDLEYEDCGKAFDCYVDVAKQIDELVELYGWCKDVGVARSSEYPEIQPVQKNLLETLEEFLREKGRKSKSPERAPPIEASPPSPPAQEEADEVVEEDPNAVKALPAPEITVDEKPDESSKEAVKVETADLVDLREEAFTADDQGNRFALALFSSDTTQTTNPDVTSAWQNPAAETGKADWELALVETASNLSNQKATLGGGFDPVLLNGIYDSGVIKHHMNSQATGGSASSVAPQIPGFNQNNGANRVLALPAPDGSVAKINDDPFSASLSVPPPSYVQMAEIEKKQHLMVQEDQLWQQYARNGMQGQVSLNKLSMGYNHVPPAMSYSYGMPQVPPTAAPIQGYAGAGGGYYYPATY